MATLTPNCISGGNILPNRALKFSAANTVIAATAATDVVVGFSDGSLRYQDATYNAIAGEAVSVQQPYEVFAYCTTASGISAGSKLSATTAGGLIVYSNAATSVPCAIALETPSADGVLFRVWFIPNSAPGA